MSQKEEQRSRDYLFSVLAWGSGSNYGNTNIKLFLLFSVKVCVKYDLILRLKLE